MKRSFLLPWPALLLGACSALAPAPEVQAPRPAISGPPAADAVAAPAPSPPATAAPPPADPPASPATAGAAPSDPPRATASATPQRGSAEGAPAPRPDATIRFLPDSDRFDDASAQALTAIAQRWSRDKSMWIVLRAYSGGGGSREYAQARAIQDSHEVEQRLVQLGVPEKRIRALSHSRRPTASTPRQVDVFLQRFRPD